MRALKLLAAAWIGGIGLACGDGDAPPPATEAAASRQETRPNILLVVWDTVRADRLSLHGHSGQTTPSLNEFAQSARVYEDALSPAGHTLPAHASMFTGLLPSEHCANNETKYLGDAHRTLAEYLSDAGYRTYLYSANPNVSATRNLAQGYEQIDHPWSDELRSRALAIVRGKLSKAYTSTPLRERLDTAALGGLPATPWSLKASGELTAAALLEWLDSGDATRPFFATLNYMEAHRPYIPSLRFREAFVEEAQLEASHTVDQSWRTTWEYTLGIKDLPDASLELMRALYDASIAEVDHHFGRLLRSLEDAGQLKNTVVIVTSDHGEHLGEQHMLDHQYSVQQAVLHVPLLVRAPAGVDGFAPGRSSDPVSTLDVFPTVLAIAGIESAPTKFAKRLDQSSPARVRIAEDPMGSPLGTRHISRAHPGFDTEPWEQKQQAWVEDGTKFLWRSKGRSSLYDLRVDPLEAEDLSEGRPEQVEAAADRLAAARREFAPCPGSGGAPPIGEAVRAMLRGLGYVDDESDSKSNSSD